MISELITTKTSKLSSSSTTNPYLIQHSDSPTTTLVSPSLSGDNYGMWIHTVTMALHAKNKLGFVDGTLSKPKDDENGFNWARCNDLVSN